ncbi:hypothetical protein ACROYT_G039278 [Oculina patagonica]
MFCYFTEGETNCPEFSADDCLTKPIGASDPGIIPDSYMTASSAEKPTERYQPFFGRLQGDRGDGWCSGSSNSNNEWLQIYFGDMFTMCRVDTQGDRNGNEWVTAFKLSFSTDESSWTTYAYAGTDVEFHRKGSSLTVDRHELPVSVQARYVRFHPTNRHVWNCLRVEVYGTKTYHFNTWLIVVNKYLTLDLLDSTTEQYKAMKTNIMSEFNSILDGFPGFFLAEFQRFGAQSTQLSSNTALLMAEIKIFCANSTVKLQLIEKIKSRIQTISMFHNDYLEAVDTVNCTCPPATVNLNLSKTLDQAKVVFASDTIDFKAEVNHSNCSSSAQLRSYWRITQATLKSRTFYSFIPGTVETDPPGWSTRLTPSLDSYFYVSYVLKILPQQSVIGYDYGYVLLLQGTPVANISGVSEVYKREGIITLNGSLSYDPHPGKAGPLTFTWFCRRSHETLPKNDSLPVVDSPNGDPSASVGCYGYGPGRLSGNENVLVVDVDKMEDGQTYVFELVVSNGLKSSKAIHYLTVQRQPQTTFLISCTYNCGPEVIPSKRMIIESNCTGDLCIKITHHHWSLFMKKDSGQSWVQISDLAERVLTDLDNPSLVITGKLGGNEYSLEMNATYKIKGSIMFQGRLAMEDNITFKTVAPLHVPTKRCRVQPEEGFVLKTNFSVDCSGWHAKNQHLTYNFSYISSAGTVIIKSATVIPNITTILPEGKKTEDYNVTIQVEILGQRGARAIDLLTVKVKPLPQKINDSSLIVKRLTNQIEKLMQNGKVSEASILAMVSLSSYDFDAAKDSVLRAMAQTQVSNINEVTQLSALVVTTTDNRDRIPINALEDAVTLLTTTTNFLRSSAQDRDMAEEAGSSILHGVSNILNASADLASVMYRELIQQENGEDLRRRTRETQNTQRDVSTAKNITESSLSLVDTVGTTLLSFKTPGERKSTIKSDSITMTIERKQPSKIGSETLSGSDEEGAVTFPSTEVLFGENETNLPSVDIQMLTLKKNPYVWSSTTKNIRSSVLILDLKKQDGSRLNISGLSHAIELFIPEKDERKAIENDTMDHLFVKSENDSSFIRYHKTKIENDFDIAFVEIRPQGNSRFDVFVNNDVKPTLGNYKFWAIIPDFSSCKHYKAEIGYFNCTSNPYVLRLSSNITGNTGVHFIGIRLASKLNEEEKRNRGSRSTRSCKDHHGRQKRSCIGVKDPPTTPPPEAEIIVPQYDERTDLNYTMGVTMRSCLYWSEKKQSWTSEGCKVGWKGVKGKLHCLCTHLSAFGGNIFVAPNPIDFEKVWTEFERLGDTGNFLVLSTVCVIFGIYIVGLVFARRADNKDLQKVVANVYLTDAQTEGYTYHLSIQTGMWKGFGTSATVGIIINGENGTSGSITLTDHIGLRKYFSRGSVNNFTLTLPSSLGKLTDIRIWHDNTGSNPAWFLQQVVITDQQTEEMNYFFANQWLSLDNRSGSIELNIKAAQENELHAFKPNFYARTARNLGDGHIWISVFTRPPHNPFTRCQRLTCCLSFLLTAMLTNAMFYQFDQTPKDTFKFGPLVMSWTQIKIGIQSSVIAIPANLVVVLIFRKTKPALSDNELYDASKNNIKPKTPGCLPPYFVYVAWCLSLLISLTGAAFIVFYSLMWRADISNQWLTSILVSLGQDILITQPIKVIAIATFLSLLIKKPPEMDPVIGTSIFKREEGDEVIANPLKEEELAKERKRRKNQQRMLEVVKETLLFAIFSFLLLVVCYGNLHPAGYQVTESVSSIFGGFDEVVDTPSLWNWVDEVLLPGLYDVTWYNGRPFQHNEGFISNKQTLLMGMPRLRQLRMKEKGSCPTDLMDTHLKDLFPGCLQAYSSDNEDRTPFHLPKWIPLENYSHFTSIDDICPKPWRYQTGEHIRTLSHQAVIKSYDGGGYVADLGYNKESASEVISDLRNNNWVDTLTAAVFIEFTLFDPSSSLFCSVRLVYERLQTGEAVTAGVVRALSLYPSASDHFQSFYEVCQVLFVVVIVVCFIAEMFKLFNQKRYFRQLWNWIELILLVVSLVAVVMSFMRGKYTSVYVKEIQSNPYETFSSDYIVHWLDLETLWLSMAIFIITLKLLRLVRFNHHICQMQGTLRRSAQPILSFSLVLFITVVAFTQFGYLSFGSTLALFSSFVNSLRVVLQMSVGKQIDYLEIYLNYPVLGSLYLFFFLCAMLFVLANVFVAILVDTYCEVREEQGTDFVDAKLGTFMFNVLIRLASEFSAKVISRIKKWANNVSRKPSKNKSYYNTKRRWKAGSLIATADEESDDDIWLEILKPTEDNRISVASNTLSTPQQNPKEDIAVNKALENKEIMNEEELLHDMKIALIAIMLSA